VGRFVYVGLSQRGTTDGCGAIMQAL